MAEASISVDQDQFSCPVCLDLLKDPVTINCGHSFCMVCINCHWDQEDQRRVYCCPQCRETFTPRPVLRRNNMLAEVVEKLKTGVQTTASSAQCYAGPGDVACDFCTGRKRKTTWSCLTCQASYCETHLKPHYEVPALKRHKLIKASTQLQEKICLQHDKLLEIYCRTDQTCICYLCTMDKHIGHDSVAASAERAEKQPLELPRGSEPTIVERSSVLCTEVTELIRAQEKAELSGAEELLEELEKEITDLKRRHTELEQLSHTEDHVQFLQSFQSVCVSSGCEDAPSITVHQHLSFDGVRESLFDLKDLLEEFCKKKLGTISSHVAALQMIVPSEPKTREDFLQYFCQLTLDPNTVNHYLSLSENNRVVTHKERVQQYTDHPERFDYWYQVLSKESVRGRCYWEVEWSSIKGYLVYISVSYKGIIRKGQNDVCWFGHNSQSWSLRCSPSFSFWNNNTETKISAPPSSRIGVYVDHSAGILSFNNVSDTLTLIHTVHTTFTQPLYAGFWVPYSGLTVQLSDP
ncbi:tripartite motif-containing protein 16-like protein [Salminus brasiliensis]|uniref:tripartite motif-containing protein 16-like protein n=1 Tax=Salminus brasiliensis TaxID=930266 RepID=UPI003B82D178